ncbi:MAG: hydrogenase maturation nickel metallochaperone HypA [Desulfomonile sp.]
MHELGIVQSILAIIEEQLKIHEGERVVKIQLEFGAMTAVMPEAIEFAFQALTREGPVAGATLDITIIPIKGVCLDCGQQVDLDSYAPFCPDCSNGILNIFQGKDEMRIVSIEIE